MSHAVNWFQIEGPNAHALQRFYKNVFGWKMNSPAGGGDSMMVAAEPGGIAGGVGASHNHQPSVTVYVSVGDIDALVGTIQRSGGRMARPKTELPGGMGAIPEFKDPAGNVVGLWMPGKKAQAPSKRRTTVKTKAPRKAAARSARVPAKKKTAAKKVVKRTARAAKRS